MNRLSPSELIAARSSALRTADYGFIFDSYHSSSNFRRQFDDREEYVRYGWASLARDFKVTRCELICEEIVGDEARVVFVMEIVSQGEPLCYAEMAWLEREEGEWRYLKGQRMEAEQMPDDESGLCPEDFDRLEPKVIF